MHDDFDVKAGSGELRVALRAARAAAEISGRYYRGDIAVSIKADRSPVTEADIECERKIRETILEAFPDHGFLGEETGGTPSDTGSLWLVDPIDGTKGFVRRYPFFSTQIALMRDGQLVLGVSSAAIMQELAWAERGSGAWLNGQPLKVSDVTDLAHASVSTGNLRTLARGGGWNVLGEITAAVDRIRGYGDFYHYHLLAAGKIDAVIESDVNVLDIAALAVIVSEAGGVFTDLEGRAVNLETQTVLAANPTLHAILLHKFRSTVS